MSQEDGRILRSQKSQNIILESIISLIISGNFYPTAEEVAKQSGIAIRTVFRQFADMESLLMKVDEYINNKLITEQKEIKLNTPLLKRLNEILIERLYLYNKYQNIMISTITQLPKYTYLQKRYPQYQKLLRARTEKVIPEIIKLDRNNQELLDATLSFIFFQRLKLQGMSQENIKKSLLLVCRKILNI